MAAKEDCEQLMNATLPFAEHLLRTNGEFFPFGARMTEYGEIVSVAAYDGRERPPSSDLIEILKKIFRADALSGAAKATALIYDVRVVPPDCDQKSDAIAVDLDHRDEYSVTVFFPYQIAREQVVIGEAFGNVGLGNTFRI